MQAAAAPPSSISRLPISHTQNLNPTPSKAPAPLPLASSSTMDPTQTSGAGDASRGGSASPTGVAFGQEAEFTGGAIPANLVRASSARADPK